jgi:hypothetical protein
MALHRDGRRPCWGVDSALASFKGPRSVTVEAVAETIARCPQIPTGVGRLPCGSNSDKPRWGRQSVYRTPLRSCFDRGAPLEASTTSWSSVW